MEQPNPTPSQSRFWRFGLPIVGSILFAVAYTQPPLYYSNQNQYFLHALAASGYGDLAHDWLANTADPTPVFSTLMAWLYQTVGEWSFHVGFFLLLQLYFLSWWAVVAALPYFPDSRLGRIALVGLLILSHSALARALSVHWTGTDYVWYLQAGVANQYLLGAGLQPSVFGVLLVSALAAFAWNRPLLAAFTIAMACTLHSTYLLHGAMLVAGMICQEAFHKRFKAAIAVALVAGVGVSYVVGYNWLTFGPTDPEQFAKAQKVLAEVRIPHHAVIGRWLDWVAWLQIGLCAVGVVLYSKTRLLGPLLVGLLGGFFLTLLQWGTGHSTLALLFPWRMSAVLIPLATGAVSVLIIAGIDRLPIRAFLLGLIALCGSISVLAGPYIMVQHLGYQSSAGEHGVLEFAKENRRDRDLYLLPGGFPKPSTSKGTGSATFVPLQDTGRPAIFELQRFRLATGASVYVDFKSIPYRDQDVLEWYRRVNDSGHWYQQQDWDRSGIIDTLRREGLTHVVIPAGVPIQSASLTTVYLDHYYRIDRIEPESEENRADD